MPENLVSRHGFGNPVPRQPAHPHTQAESGAYSQDSSQLRGGVYLFIVTVCMYGHTYSKSMDQPNKVANAARGQLNIKIYIYPCPHSRLRILSHETGAAVPSHVSLLFSILRLNSVLTYGIPPEFCGGVHLFISKRHTSSGQSRVYRVTQLRTDGVRCRESAGTGPLNLKVVPNEWVLPWQVPIDQLICASLSHARYRDEVGMLKVPCMYLHYINSKGKDQPGKIANPAHRQLNREKCFLPCPRSHLRTWSRDTGSAGVRQSRTSSGCSSPYSG